MFTDLEYYLAIKRDEILPFATAWIALRVLCILSEVSQMGKDKNHMISLICGM